MLHPGVWCFNKVKCYLQAKEECCRKLSQCSGYSNSADSMDIENLHQLACVDSPTHSSADSTWLTVSADGRHQ